MTRHFLILLLLPLAACATPQQQCQRDATRDLRVLDELIAETQANVTRGYAIEEEVVPRVGFTTCFGNGFYGTGHAGVSFCSGTSTSIRRTPVAIDVEAERRKLAGLEQSRTAAATRAQGALAACQARFGA